MAFIEDLAPQKITANILGVGLFCGAGFYKRREKNYKEKNCKNLIKRHIFTYI